MQTCAIAVSPSMGTNKIWLTLVLIGIILLANFA